MKVLGKNRSIGGAQIALIDTREGEVIFLFNRRMIRLKALRRRVVAIIYVIKVFNVGLVNFADTVICVFCIDFGNTLCKCFESSVDLWIID